MATTALEVDVTIVGGGMVGASLAVALQGSGVRVMLIESVPFESGAQQSFDARTTALGNASQRIYAALGVWEGVAGAAQPIRSIHVSEAGRFGFARLEAREQGIEAFGYVIANRVLGAALWQRLARADAQLLLRVPARIDHIEPGAEAVAFTVQGEAGASETVRTRLIVAADGAQSLVRSAAGIAASVEDYDQVAVVTTVAADQPHGARAYERFTPSGPLAVLPLHDGTLAVIWARTPADARTLLALQEADYLAELQAAFGWRAGRFVRAGARGSYPLRLTRAATAVAQRTVLIGNAAQALHPVAGQGFNLGLRDAAMLAELIVAEPAAAGDPAQLQRFADWRAGDRAGVTRFTDSLVKLFGDPRPGVGLLRSLGLLAFDLAPPAKSALARVSAGFAGPIPRLARGLPVRHV
ncbi:MAG: 2-octaprenyl-6-methoxyphenyl hydroxylase [Proteobacteria bacterium]|nr:2-octaprenyl-6-methoxyphenyl hydroxylase [Pseudomonadota bacterium]